MDCETSISLLPWLINGSLHPEEREAVVLHLSRCKDCSKEFLELMEVWQLLNWHPSSMTIAQYGQGMSVGGLNRTSLERHLVVCASCQQELNLVGCENPEVKRLNDYRPHPGAVYFSARKWSLWAVAASLFVAVATAGLLGFQDSKLLQTDFAPTEVESSEELDDAVLFADGFEGSVFAWASSTLERPRQRIASSENDIEDSP